MGHSLLPLSQEGWWGLLQLLSGGEEGRALTAALQVCSLQALPLCLREAAILMEKDLALAIS